MTRQPPGEDLDVTFGLKPDVNESGLLLDAVHEHDWVLVNLAVGSSVDSHEVAGLIRDGITHVIDCQAVGSPDIYLNTTIQYLHCPTDDDGDPKGFEWFDPGVRFGVAAMQGDGRLLVHCTAGINRGPSMTYAILLALQWEREAAFTVIKQSRPMVFMAYRQDADRYIGKQYRSNR